MTTHPIAAMEATEEDYSNAAELFKALAHPLRVKLVCGLIKSPANQTQLSRELSIPQSSLAQHLAVLRRAGLVDGRRNGPEVVLEVTDERIPRIFQSMCADELVKLDFDK